MNPWTWIPLTLLCVALYLYLRKRFRYFEELSIPYLPGWPLLGNMGAVLFRRKNIQDVIVDIYRVHPTAKYVGAFDFMRPVIVLRDLDLIKSIGIRHFANFPDHNAFVDEAIDPLFGANPFNMTGDRWKEIHNLLAPTFTSSKLKATCELIVDCAKNFVDFLSEQPRSRLKMIGAKDLFSKYTNDCVATFAFGLRVDSLNNPNNEFYKRGRAAANFEGLQGLKFLMTRAFPRLTKALRIKFASERVVGFFENIVGVTVRTRDERGIKRPDMLQVMMDARNKTRTDNTSITLDVPMMAAQAFGFYFGGFEITSAQMCIIAHELAINPDVQRRLQNEIDEVMERTEGKPKYEDVVAMPYIDAVFNESMRRHTQAAVIDRLCVEAFELPPAVPGAEPYVLQPGSIVWIPAAAIHMDPLLHENPDRFDPDRYYRKKVTTNDATNLGFGIGPRACIGNRFAVLNTKILFIFLLRMFNLVPNSKTAIPFVYDKSSFTIQAKGGYWLEIEPRIHNYGPV